MKVSRIVGDVSRTDASGFGARTLIWWGVLGFILIEGTGFLLAGGAYVYLIGHTRPWPPNTVPPPALLWGGLFTLVMVLSELPNLWTEKQARRMSLKGSRLGLIVMSLIGLALCGLRAMEFQHLNVRWDENAYGSIVWALMLLHTVHLVTDLADTLVLTLFTYTHEVDADRYSDVADNGMYWGFVVLSWLPIAGLVYLAPRLL